MKGEVTDILYTCFADELRFCFSIFYIVEVTQIETSQNTTAPPLHIPELVPTQHVLNLLTN